MWWASKYREQPLGEVGATIVRGIVATASLSLICSIGALVVPLFNMQIFNRVLPTRDTATMIDLVAGLCIMLVIVFALDFLRGLTQEVLASRVVLQLSVSMIRSLSNSTRPDLSASEALVAIEKLRNFLAGRACLAPFEIAWSPVMVIALASMHWALGLFGVCCISIMVCANIAGDVLSRRAILLANAETATALRCAGEGVAAAEAVIALGMMPILSNKWRSAERNAANKIRRALSRARAVSATTNALRASMTGAMVALGLSLALSGLASSGSMVASNMILARLLMPFAGLAASRREWLDVYAACERLIKVIGKETSVRSASSFPEPQGRLVVEKLVYIPPGCDRATIRGISFSADPGDVIALIGSSSAGKTTLVRLVMGIVAPSSGGVYLDGISTYNWGREDLARHVGFLPQRATLVEESVAANIARLQPMDFVRIVAAAKDAGLHNRIATLPNGYSTLVKGNILSGGERQKLALARAIYTRPKLLVLDEPSAFLDEMGEGELVKLMWRLRATGTTILLVTHRPALLNVASKVLVLRDGSVMQSGSPREVIASVPRRPVQLIRAANDQLRV